MITFYKKRKLSLAVAGGIAICALVVSRITASGGSKSEGESKYEEVRATKGDVAEFVTAVGTVNPIDMVSVGSQLSGTVVKVHVDFNSQVKAGDVLAELDPSVYESAIRQARASVDSASAALMLSKTTYNRTNELFKRGLISRSDLDKDSSDLVVSESQLKSAAASLDRARADQRNSVIVSPIDGVVIRRNIEPGQTVAATFQTPVLFVIAKDTGKMQINASLSEADVAGVTTGLAVDFTVAAYPEKKLKGVVRQLRLDSSKQQGSVSYDLVVDVSNQDAVLLPGMTAQLLIVTDVRKSVLRVPTAALRFSPERSSTLGAKSDEEVTEHLHSAAKASDGDASNQDDGRPVITVNEGGKFGRVYAVSSDGALKALPVLVGHANPKYSEIVDGLRINEQIVVRELTR
ncbi:MAG: efflux RND transporter periplasmic adaptor subunit [Steroidobacteraceae bacterium]